MYLNRLYNVILSNDIHKTFNEIDKKIACKVQTHTSKWSNNTYDCNYDAIEIGTGLGTSKLDWKLWAKHKLVKYTVGENIIGTNITI